MYRQNLHIHSSFCDGADTPEQIILRAIAMGFDSIGFSGHSYMSYSPNHSMSLEGTQDYIREVNALKEKYRDHIRVYCGLEYDLYSDVDTSAYDYIIGSVHYFDIGGQKVGFDRSSQEVQDIIHTYFGGDGLRYAKAYYELLAQLPNYGDFDILGHPDLITKHSENCDFFDQDSRQYRDAAIGALESLAGKIPFFEVNTGAIARGYRTTAYPATFLLKELKRLGFGATISSDCHDVRQLDCGFNLARDLLKSCGFREIYILSDNGFVPMPI